MEGEAFCRSSAAQRGQDLCRSSVEIQRDFRRVVVRRPPKGYSRYAHTNIDIVYSKDRDSIDNGASAIVHHARFGDQALEVAVKRFRLAQNTIRRVQKAFCKEAVILRLLRHPNIVPFVGIVVGKHDFSIVSVWMRNGDIMNYLRTNPGAAKKELLEQVADGLDFLTKRSIVHGDLKGSNVMIDSEGTARISDFGTSFVVGIDETVRSETAQHAETPRAIAWMPPSATCTSASNSSATFSGIGTSGWMSPERLFPERFGMKSRMPTFQSDVYSFGMLVYQVYSGRHPFQGMSAAKIIMAVMADQRPERPVALVSDELWSLVQQCWSTEPRKRPRIWDVYNRLAIMVDVA
ncbi:hypothetical protein PLICRDRAFT_41961 [Plicaturopsis crispa FD-325 SS-3]|nr:hypothetical protein PLICRDRAFT_41961 [Plicaturopsis crispa FD-325 SS-3]